MDNKINKSDHECVEMLKYIFSDAGQLYNQLAPDGLKKSELVLFFHPTPEQRYKEAIRMRDNINRLFRKSEKNNRDKEKIKLSDFETDDLTDIAEYDEFLYILGLSIYDIFSNNHEVIGEDNKIYDLGSFRGSGGFMANFFAKHFPDYSEEFNYMDFYMGSIWIKDRGDLTPFYEYIFRKLKDRNCDWRYFFPRIFAVDPKCLIDNPKEDELENYNPESAAQQQLDLDEKSQQRNKLQEDLDKAYQEKYEEAKYKPLIPLVQAYKNIYGHLPDGHPQKEFE